MRSRLGFPPDSIAALASASRGGAAGPIFFARGEVLGLVPPGSNPIALSAPQPSWAEPVSRAVATRLDVEEREPFARPRLQTIERARDFYLADDTGRALVRLADAHGHLHPDADLRLEAPFLEYVSPATPTAVVTLTQLRTLEVGQPAYVCGHIRYENDPSGLGGYRDLPGLPVFAADLGLLYLYDEPAFHQLAAWHALPWYRKLSLLVRNR